NHWCLMEFPVAVSHFTVFWNIITPTVTPSLPVMGGELITPLLAAFLGAHSLSHEYKTRVGAILASKPLKISKVVVLRLSALLILVWILELISLGAYYFGMAPFDISKSFLASVPSTLFLTMLAV